MSVQSIIDFINNHYYIINNQVSRINYFRGDINEYYNNNLIEIIKNNFDKYKDISEQSIIITHNNMDFYISYELENDELYWRVNIIKNDNYFL